MATTRLIRGSKAAARIARPPPSDSPTTVTSVSPANRLSGSLIALPLLAAPPVNVKPSPARQAHPTRGGGPRRAALKICMLARNPNLYSHQRLCEAAKARGHEIQVVNTLRCYMNITSHRPSIHYKGEHLGGFDAVIPRIGASVTSYGTAVLRQFEMMGVYPLNESVAISRAQRYRGAPK